MTFDALLEKVLLSSVNVPPMLVFCTLMAEFGLERILVIRLLVIELDPLRLVATIPLWLAPEPSGTPDRLISTPFKTSAEELAALMPLLPVFEEKSISIERSVTLEAELSETPWPVELLIVPPEAFCVLLPSPVTVTLPVVELSRMPLAQLVAETLMKVAVGLPLVRLTAAVQFVPVTVVSATVRLPKLLPSNALPEVVF